MFAYPLGRFSKTSNLILPPQFNSSSQDRDLDNGMKGCGRSVGTGQEGGAKEENR